MKFSKSSKVLTDAVNVTQKYIESRYSSDSLINKQSISLIQYTHNVDDIHSYEWANFQDIEQFGSFIINSKKIPILEYIFRWSDDLQSIPRIQSFINDHKNLLNKNYTKSNLGYKPVIARSLLIILQENFWRGLMESYFKYFHPYRPLFSLVNFNPKTASGSLLSAIYFAGFVIQSNSTDEVYSYMHNYAICNIKKMLYTVNLSNVQALGIYSYAFYLIGSSSLSRVCCSHFGRMCHSLGLSIDRKNLNILDQYNRKLVYNIVKLYYNWTKLGISPYALISQEDEFDLDVYDPVCQLPNSSLNLYNNDYESVAYSIFCCAFAKLSNFSVAINSKFCKYEVKTVKKEIGTFNRITNEVYNDAKLALEALIDIAPEYKNQILAYLIMIKAPYIICILCIYSKKLEILNNRSLNLIQSILDNDLPSLYDKAEENDSFYSKVYNEPVSEGRFRL
ncbi:hypothetical protein CONCODRAFT_9505 [Conidiobolus coronatus NRRL 28638]|uniref:Transcription factor domain-containing protein n=1 Tax=Conidiobolus coronatus (strain ATCC 28846 / CBS 209.66 / NRRL 28638) TaxID=796925 RepID=A0A137NZL5_CONC2|nr:hypothetical protein CONCODRAFT_9505 [Conidiobolus coronatus NRRL 28638]|eukprot:KXN68276.1 hypothetical protein CONCODRAFT_9505 [Conidiobolus coronatus NRRL 28638]